MRLKKERCAFLLPTVDYLMHGITSNGLEATASKIAAIVDAPAPRNQTELRSMLGMVNYYRKYLPDVATILTLFITSCRRVRNGTGVMSSRKH